MKYSMTYSAELIKEVHCIVFKITPLLSIMEYKQKIVLKDNDAVVSQRCDFR